MVVRTKSRERRTYSTRDVYNSMELFGPSSDLQESAEGIQARGVHGNTNHISDVVRSIYRRGPCSTWTHGTINNRGDEEDAE